MERARTFLTPYRVKPGGPRRKDDRRGAWLRTPRVTGKVAQMKRWATLASFFLSLGCGTSSTPLADAGAPPPDGGSDAVMDAKGDVVEEDGAAGGCVNRLACAACYDAGDTCCLLPNASPPPDYATTCTACPADGGVMSVTLGCGGDSDCPGGVCCIAKRGNLVAAACARSCAQSEAELCDPGVATNKCPANLPCSSGASSAWNIPSCYGTCGPTPPP
jgi:hypothetical protein